MQSRRHGVIPYPDRPRALRAVRRRRAAYRRATATTFQSIVSWQACALSDELGFDLSQFTATTTDVLRPVQDHIAERTRHYQDRWGPTFEQLFLNTQITALDTPTISTA